MREGLSTCFPGRCVGADDMLVHQGGRENSGRVLLQVRGLLGIRGN